MLYNSNNGYKFNLTFDLFLIANVSLFDLIGGHFSIVRCRIVGGIAMALQDTSECIYKYTD